MEYSMIKPGDQQQLRAERLAALEADHYRCGLMAEDATSAEEAEQARRSQHDIERRIRVHRVALGLEPASAIEEPGDSHVDINDGITESPAETDTMDRVA